MCERERKRSSILWFTPQMSSVPGAVPNIAKNAIWVSHTAGRSQVLVPPSTAFPVHSRELLMSNLSIPDVGTDLHD